MNDEQDMAPSTPAALSAQEAARRLVGSFPDDASHARKQVAGRGSIGMQLYASRGMARMTQAQLAERSGVAQSDISDFERGKGNPTAQTLGKLAEALGITFTIGADAARAG